MATVLKSNLFPTTNTISNPNKKWDSLFTAINCTRKFSSLLIKSPSPNLIFPRSLSHVSPSVTPENNPFGIDQTTLVDIVKEKKLVTLRERGGVNGVASDLRTDTRVGVTEDEDRLRRRETFGSNTYRRRPTKELFHFVIEAFKDLTIMIVLGCDCAALALIGFGTKEHGRKESWYYGGSIFIAVALGIVVLAVCRQNKQFDKLSKQNNNIQIHVLRGSQHRKISTFDIVVGDVVFLETGDQVPADGLFLDGHSLQVDESSMTGARIHVEVNSRQNPFLLSGSKVADGHASMLVTSVGMNTTWGQMMCQINCDSNEETPLQTRLNKLNSSIHRVGLAITLLFLVVLLVRYFTGHMTSDDEGNQEFNGSKRKSDDIISSTVGIVAAAVSIVDASILEGLPLAVILTLAYSMKRMMADQAMVRKLSALETMGSVTTICTNKTGTLTLNRMKVTKFWLGQEYMNEEEGDASSISPFIVDLIHQGVALNTTESVYRASPGTEFEFSGSPTEKAILSWAVLKMKMDMKKTKTSCAIRQVETFNSGSGVLIGRNDDDTSHVHWKGAAETILAMCSSYYDASGVVKDIDDDERMKLEQIIQGMAASSLTCIAFAHKQVSEEECDDLQENSLNLLGVVGIKNSCRPGVKKAVEDCQYAGISTRLITSDNIFTARAIATECGILKPCQNMSSGVVVEGEEFRNYTPQERMEKVEEILVMARSSPFDKLLMVQCLKQKGHVVAVTGDGTNDVRALKEADIGLLMGIQGTEAEKESSDIIILDDNSVSVAVVFKWGRCIYSNIQKFTQFQLTVNVTTLCINFVASVSAAKVPLTAVQIMWLNLIMNPLGALALATDQPTKELMEKPPVGRTEPLITNIMWRNLLAQALYQITILLTLQFAGESIFEVTEKVNDTLIFNTFVLCQVFNEFNARELEKKNVFERIHKNKLFIGIIGITIVLQLVMVEFLKRFADTERLNWGEWGVCIALAAVSWPLGWVVKYVPVPEKPIFSYLKWRK